MVTLHTTPLSANGRKVLSVARHLGSAANVKLVNVYRGEGRTPEHLTVNPLGKIPVLVDGDLTLTESNAILVYLAEAHGGGRLWSTEPRRRAEILRWLFWEASEWQPALVAVLTGHVAQKLGLTPPSPPAVVDWSDARIRTLATYLDTHLRDRAFVANELSVADFSIAAMLMYVDGTGFPFDMYPNIGAWLARIEGLEAWREATVEPWH